MNSYRKGRGLFAERQLSFIIFACPKSGTTWLQRMLGAHPEALCAESRAFGNYYDPHSPTLPHITLEKYLGILSHYFAPSVEALKPANAAFHRGLLFNLVDTIAATARSAVNKPVYGEKITPYRGTAEHVVEILHEYHRGLRFVNLVRDGRDVIVSGAAQWLNNRIRRATPEEKPALEEALKNRAMPPHDFEMFLDNWIDAVSAGLKAKSKFHHFLELRYEELVADPIAQTAKLFRFLDLDAGPGVIRSCVEAASFDKLSGGRSRGEEDPNSFFRKGAVGDWKNWFNEEQKQRFERRAGEVARAAGYL